jgi:hypothetical protein
MIIITWLTNKTIICLCLCSRHWILAMIYPKEGIICLCVCVAIIGFWQWYIWRRVRSLYSTLLTSTNLLTRNSSIVFKDKQHINRVFISNLVITIVANDDPFHNNVYKWYVSQGGRHSPKHKEEMHVHYIFSVLTYTSL